MGGRVPDVGFAPLETLGFLLSMVVDIRPSIYGEQQSAAGRLVIMCRTGLAPDIVTGGCNPVVILDATFQDERLFNLRMFMKRDVGTWFQFEQAGHFTALGILVKHLDRNLFKACWLPIHFGRLDVGRAADSGNQ